jgi:hypothetical protein
MISADMLAGEMGYKIIPGSARPVSRNIVVRSREQQKIEILVVVNEGLLELEHRCGVHTDVQKTVDQQKLSLEIGRIGHPPEEYTKAKSASGTTKTSATALDVAHNLPRETTLVGQFWWDVSGVALLDSSR